MFEHGTCGWFLSFLFLKNEQESNCRFGTSYSVLGFSQNFSNFVSSVNMELMKNFKLIQKIQILIEFFQK
jgi:hypothetical protein